MKEFAFLMTKLRPGPRRDMQCKRLQCYYTGGVNESTTFFDFAHSSQSDVVSMEAGSGVSFSGLLKGPDTSGEQAAISQLAVAAIIRLMISYLAYLHLSSYQRLSLYFVYNDRFSTLNQNEGDSCRATNNQGSMSKISVALVSAKRNLIDC